MWDVGSVGFEDLRGSSGVTVDSGQWGRELAIHILAQGAQEKARPLVVFAFKPPPKQKLERRWNS